MHFIIFDMGYGYDYDNDYGWFNKHKLTDVRVRMMKITSTSSSTTSSSTTSALYSKRRSLIGFESNDPLMNGNESNVPVHGRCCGSLINDFDKNSLKSFDHFDGWSNLGGSLFWIFNKTRIGDISLFGGSIWANSINVIPNDQISTL